MNIIEDLIYPVLDEIREMAEFPEKLEQSPDTPLFGPGGVLDSLALVTFIIAIEQSIEEQTGYSIILASEKTMSRSQSPFRTVATLAGYIRELLEEEGHG
jgi:acyl carrier protein